ncbi:hypothetical protein EV363DRAFT_1296447 [Boletus edulis]|nr:hypothetical protein EV363DRAFT_1296447 [Boletus edulis]
MPYEVQLEDGMKIQVSSLNGHNWSHYREKLIHAAREARRATPEHDYTTVLTLVRTNQRPKTIYEQRCKLRWQLQVGEHLRRGEMGETLRGRVEEGTAAASGPGKMTTDHQRTDGVSLATPASGPRDDYGDHTKVHHHHTVVLPTSSTLRLRVHDSEDPCATTALSQALGEATSGIMHDSEVPRAATTQPPERQLASQTGGRTDGGSTATEDHCAATVQPQTAQTTSRRVHEETADIENPYAMRAEPTMPADRSQNPRDKPLELRAGEEVGGGWGASEKTREAGQRPREQNEVASEARPPALHLPESISVPLEGERENQLTIDPADEEESKGVIDDTNDMVHTPSGCVGQRKAQTSDSRVSGEGTKGTGEPNDEGNSPENPGKPSDKPRNKSRHPTDRVQVEPGGKTTVKPNGRTASRNTGAEVDRHDVQARRNVQDKVERSTACRDALIEGERKDSITRGRSTTAIEENDQRHETGVKDLPEKLPVPPKPPDEAADRASEPESLELEGERDEYPSVEPELTGAEADATGMSGSVEDPSNVPKKPYNRPGRVSEPQSIKLEGEKGKYPSYDDVPTGDNADTTGPFRRHEDVMDMPSELRKASEHEREHSETREQKNSPKRASVELTEPGCEAVVQGGYQRIQEGPRTVRNERVDRTNASNRDTRPGGHMGPRGVTRVVEGDSGRGNVVEGGAHNGIDPRSHGNERVIETRALRRGRRPGGLIEVQEARRDIERELKRGIDADGVQMDGNGDGTGAATSAAHRDSKRVETDALAEYQANQHGKPKRTKTDVPEASKPPSNHLRRSTDHANPPRRRGQLKSNPRSVNTTGLTHQATKTHRD